MNVLIILLFFFHLSSSFGQQRLQDAEKNAVDSNKLILLNFSGSDWCIPCIEMHRNIFENNQFQQYSQQKLVFINADFPRSKKHQVSKELQAENERLADAYNNQGAFPLTILLDAKGKILKSWDGLPKENAVDFINEVDLFYQKTFEKK
ncbi:MAG: thioredoxin family protein [Pseudopedobacter saltans]|uniref:Thioredoxin family protein n=1 Tax=Pseudopedobacter saltans TaxID=151895 RepID=A0A2W5ESK6_9SPHI|nr:MAG: thioredoxin family protein [Pseudopedobacter saltans]